MVWRCTKIIILCLVAVVTVGTSGSVRAQENGKKLVTVHDRGSVRVFLTDKKVLSEALKAENIVVDTHDFVEPSIDQELIAPDYKVNIYRARPVVVVDGETRIKAISAYQTPRQIAKDVKITIYDEDTTLLRPSTDFVNDGAGLVLTINRSLVVNLDLYGKVTTVRTQAKTVGDMLTEKKIVLGVNGRVMPSAETKLTANLAVRVWREGKQTISVDQPIPVSSQIVYDADRPLGYRAVQITGVPGNRSISYQIEVKDGIEISRQEIANIVTKQSTDTTEVIGIRNDGGGLTESRGAQMYTDSKGIVHRETYYDLNMAVVMQSCGQGGRYTVRPDGAKVDAQGYIIVAANYSNYPKCTLVETSLGTGKVYDTGGFALRHPFGFDLATDWTRGDGI
jgi:uncharacterized protein YabE (DUF348 family)